MEPSVYLAIYSGQKVYEMMVNGIPVMKRVEDSYLNATQILKVCGFSKPRRTRILEQECHTTTHEKIQGGYGKYQGTWIPFDLAVTMAKKYALEESLAPLLYFNPATDQLAPKPLIVRKASIGSNEKVSPSEESTPTDVSEMSPNNETGGDSMAVDTSETSARDALRPPPPQASEKKVNPSPTSSANLPAPEHAITKRTPIRSRAPSSTTVESPENELGGHAQKDQEPTPRYQTEIATAPAESSFKFAPVPVLPSVSRRLFDDEPAQHHFFESVYNRRLRLKHDYQDFAAGSVENYDYAPVPNPPKLSPAARKQELLLHIFSRKDNALNNAFFLEILRNEKEKMKFDADLVLDDRESTPLHWAVSCGRVNLARLLISRGATVMKVANGGETALMRAVTSLTPFTDRSMDDILVLLGSSLFALDHKKRSTLHHVVLLSKFRSKRVMSNYYMECISDFIEDTKKTSKISFAAFLDSTDENGDSALHIACRYRNHRIVFLLLSLGASKTIQNTEGDTAISLSAGDPRLKKLMQYLPEPEYDDYLDAPTTPMSDFSEPEDFTRGENVDTSTPLEVNRSSSTLSSIGPLLDSQVSSTAAQLASSKMYIAEMKYQKARFEEVLKYAGKVQVALERPSTPLSILPTANDGANEEADQNGAVGVKRPRAGQVAMNAQRTLAQENKLSSRLVRLESMVKASKEEQYELLKRIELIKQERVLKDERYTRLISTACTRNPDAMEGILTKIADNL